jgi:hypothetical protein
MQIFGNSILILSRFAQPTAWDFNADLDNGRREEGGRLKRQHFNVNFPSTHFGSFCAHIYISDNVLSAMRCDNGLQICNLVSLMFV